MDNIKLVSLLDEYKSNPSDELMETLVEENIKLAEIASARFSNRGIERDDLFQVASMALIKAIKRFNSDKQVKFITYAMQTITGEVRNYIRDKGNTIRASRTARSALYNMQKERQKFQNENFRDPTLPELAKLMNTSVDEIIKLLARQAETATTSLDTSISQEDEQSLMNVIGTTDDGYDKIDRDSFMIWVKKHVSDQEYKLLILRYHDKLGQRAVAQELGVSQMQVSRLEKRILTRLRSLGAHSDIK